MDLGRLGSRGIRSLSNTTRSLVEFVGDLLDGDLNSFANPTGSDQSAAFATRSDVESIAARCISVSTQEGELDELFQQLAPFYEAGFHLRRQPTPGTDVRWVLRGLFLFGRPFTPDQLAPCPFIPPSLAPGRVARGRGHAVLKAFELDRLTQLNDSKAFLFGIDGRSVFLFLSDLPAPWLEDHIVRTRGVLDAILCEARG